MKRTSGALLVLGVASVLALTVGCTSAAREAASPAPLPAQEKPQYGGVYRWVTSNPRIGQDPNKGTGTSFTHNFGRALSSLLRFKTAPDLSESTFIIAPELAERWETPNDTTWLLHIRKGVKWHNVPPINGREFIADDAVYGINRLRSTGSAQAGYWQDVEKVEALDRYTVKITLKEPSAPFASILAFGFNKMVAKEVVDSVGGNIDNGPNIGTGAWMITCTVDVDCFFKRNPDYFLKDAAGNQLPYMDGMRGLVINDVQAVFAAFRAKQLDSHSLTPEERVVADRSLPELLRKDTRSFSGTMIHFRGDRAPWKDERVRIAASKAINRQEVIDTIVGGRGFLFLAMAMPGDDWHLSQEEFRQAYKQDIEAAKKLLAEAGYPNGLDASLWVANYGVADVPRAELLVSQLAKAGIRVKLNVHDRPTYLTRVFKRDGEFEDMAIGPQGTFLEPDLWLSAYYHSKGGRNSSFTNDPKLDQMIEGQRREQNAEKRKQLMHEVQRYLLQKNYQLVVMGSISDNTWWPWLKNRGFSAGGDYPGAREVEYYWIDQKLRKEMGAPE